MNQFRKPKINVIIGPDIHLYHPKDGGTAFYLPLIFTNGSPTKGVIEGVYLRVMTPEGKYYFLNWSEEASIKIRAWDYTHTDRAKPFTVDGYAALSKVYWFLWPNNNSKQLLFKTGEYTFTVFILTKNGKYEKVNRSEILEVNTDLENIFQKRLEANDATTQIKYFKGKSLIAVFASTGDLDFLNKIDRE